MVLRLVWNLKNSRILKMNEREEFRKIENFEF